MKKLYAYIFFLLPSVAMAQTCDGLICNPLSGFTTSDNRPVETVTDIIDLMLQILIQLAIPITAGFIIWGGFNFALSKGDPTKVKKARSSLMYIIIGFCVILLSKGIQLAIQSTIETLK